MISNTNWYGKARFLTVAKRKPLGNKTEKQGAKESSAPEFILFVQVWLKKPLK